MNEIKFPVSLAKDSKAAISHILEEYERFNTCVLRPVNCVILWLIRFVFLATECQFNFCTFFPIPSSVSRYFKTENNVLIKQFRNTTIKTTWHLSKSCIDLKFSEITFFSWNINNEKTHYTRQTLNLHKCSLSVKTRKK